MLATWRLIHDGAGDAAWNMAVDEAILEAVRLGEVPPTLRFYRWTRPAISLGRSQQWAKVIHLAHCYQRHIPVVQRLTGGKAVLHGHDLTLCAVIPLRCLLPAHRVNEVHLRIVNALARGLHRLGIDARPARHADPHALHGTHAGCFEYALPGDLTSSEGVKLVGGAQYRRAEVVMEQMSIPVEPLPERLRGCLKPWREPPPSPLQGIPVDELMRAIAQGFADEFRVEWQAALLSAAEIDRAHQLVDKYSIPLHESMLDTPAEPSFI
ncbi:MAG: hypothetical protein RMM06_05365 [Armatimonadota bacterium]|nr:hypothetical protein [bacterium]MCS7309598.1 hypothetical protein [Armatimonadota bacterium]MDW8290130.1 hypothetical protein [Armatimonadota bacterium]